MGDRQVRATNGIIIGWDMVAALAVGEALGVSKFLIAEMLPAIEPVAMAALHKRAQENG